MKENLLKPLVFVTKDEDYAGSKLLGSTDPKWRLIELLKMIKDFDPKELELQLHDKDRFAGTLLIGFEAVSVEREKALLLKKE